MWPKNFKSAVLVGCGAAVLSGCASTYSLDLTRDREDNLARDLSAFQKSDATVPAGELSLHEAINVALRNNLELRVAEFELEAAKDDAYSNKLNMLPDLRLSGQRSKRDRQYGQDYIDRNTGAPITSNNQGSFRNSLTGDLSLTWNVLDFGMSYIRARQAGMEVQVKQLARMRQAQLIALEVTQVYWNAALAEDTLDYVRAIERELEHQKQMIDRSVREQRIDPIMAKDAERRLVDLELSIRDLQAEVSSSRVRLAELMGVLDRDDIKLERQAIRPLMAALPRPTQLDVNVLQDYALDHRPELFQQDLYRRIRKDDVKAQILSMFPDLTFGVGAHYDDNRLLSANNWNTFGVNLGWNLLKLPSAKKRVDARKDAVKAAELESMQTTLGVVTQVQLSLLDYAVKVDRFLLLEESYGLANNLLSMVKEHNKAGRISDLSVTQRVLEDLAAKMRRDKSVVEVIVGYRRMLSSIGLDLTYWNENLNEFSLLKANAGEAGIDDLSAKVAPTVKYQTPEFSQPATAVPSSYSYQASAPEHLNTTHMKVGTVVSSRVIEDDEWDSQPVRSANVTKLGGWSVQVGAYSKRQSAKTSLEKATRIAGNRYSHAEEAIVPSVGSKGTIYKARMAGLSKSEATKLCQTLKANGMECVIRQEAKLASYE